MKTGKTLTELAAEIQRQANSKRDYIAPAQKLEMEYRVDDTSQTAPNLLMKNGQVSRYGITNMAHDQIAGRLEIPRAYYERMRSGSREDRALLAGNVNHWLGKTDTKFMVRTIDQNVRALLSDRYRPLDNFDLAEAVLPKLLDAGCEVVSCELTEQRLYIKAVTPRIQGEVKLGEVMQAGVAISNSEIGMGSIKVEPLAYKLACLNGLIINDMAMRKKHIGKKNSFVEFEAAEQYFRDETRIADDRAFWMKVSDVVTATLDETIFHKLIDRFRVATEQQISRDPVEVVQLTAKRFGFSDGERSGILTHLIKGGELNAWGLVNAVTRAAQDVESYDRSTDLEHTAAEILELPKSEWRQLAEAA